MKITVADHGRLEPFNWFAHGVGSLGDLKKCSYSKRGRCSENGTARWSYRRNGQMTALCDHHALRVIVEHLGGRDLDLRPSQVVKAS